MFLKKNPAPQPLNAVKGEDASQPSPEATNQENIPNYDANTTPHPLTPTASQIIDHPPTLLLTHRFEEDPLQTPQICWPSPFRNLSMKSPSKSSKSIALAFLAKTYRRKPAGKGQAEGADNAGDGVVECAVAGTSGSTQVPKPIYLPQLLPVVKRKARASLRTSEEDDEDGETMKTRGKLNEETEKLRQATRAIENPLNPPDDEAIISYAQFVASYRAKSKAAITGSVGAHEALLKLLKQNDHNPLVVGPILDAFAALCEDSPEMQLFTAANVLTAVRALPIIDDPDCVYRYVDLMEDLIVFGTEAAVECIAKDKILKDLELIEASCDPDDMLLLSTIEDVRKALSADNPGLTLKEVYSILMARQYNSESLIISEERRVRRLFNFVRKKTYEYGVKAEINEGSSCFRCTEMMFGCLSLQLLAETEENHVVMRRYEVAQLIFEMMETQKDEQIAQHAVLTALELAQHEELVSSFVDSREKIVAIVNMLKRGRKAVENDPYNVVEDIVGPRVLLIERTAQTRETYDKTDAVEELIETWDDYDYYFYGNIRVKNDSDLKAIFRQDRKEKRRTNLVKKLVRHHDQSTSPLDYSIVNPLQRRVSLLPNAPSPLEQRKSMIGVNQGPTVSPLERRKSIVALGQTTSASPSPLERRRSVVTNGGVERRRWSVNMRRSSLAELVEGGSSSRSSPSLMKRASQFFGKSALALQATVPDSMVPAGLGGTIAQARALAQKGEVAAPQRRASFFGGHRGGSALLPAAPPPEFNQRASLLQRRASMQTPEHGGLRKNTALSSSSTSGFGVSNSCKSLRSLESATSRWSFAVDEDTDGVFIPEMIEHVFKALRKTVHLGYKNLIKSRNVPMRLVGLCADHETPPGALPDILYQIGVLAGSDKQFKDEFGEYQAVEKVCSLIKRAHKQRGAYVSEVVTNASLCLATLCAVHLPHTHRFVKKKGPHLIVEALNIRGQFNDAQAVNGLSTLICNLCFKNEEMKAILGKARAPEALVNAMGNYHATGNVEEGSRNISSLFKAIGNMALNAENMEQLIEARIESAYSSFLGEVDSELDDATLECALRTLSNLVIEKDNVDRFASIVIPFLSMIRRERSLSTEVHRWAFMTLTGLCRIPKNAEMFTANEGVKTVIRLLPHLEATPSLRSSLICVLGIQTTHPPNVNVLLDNGIFEILAECLKDFLELACANKEVLASLSHLASGVGSNSSGGAEMSRAEESQNILIYSQLPISALRCAHRCLTHRGAAQACIKSGVFRCAQEAMMISEWQPMLGYEALRVIFGCMDLIDPSQFSSKEGLPMFSEAVKSRGGSVPVEMESLITSNWGEEIVECLLALEDPFPQLPQYFDPTKPDWWLSLSPHVRRTKSRPIWELLDMQTRLNGLVEVCRTMASNTRTCRNVRLQRCLLGLMAWLSCERICIPTLLRRLNLPINPNTHTPEKDLQDDFLDSTAPKMMIQRRKSVWDAFKRDKTDKNLPKKKTGFAYDRKPDPTSIVVIIQRTIKELNFDHDSIDLALLLLNNCLFAAWAQPDLAPLIADADLYKDLKAFVNSMSDKAKAYWLLTVQNYKRFIKLEGKWSLDEESDNSDASVTKTMEKRLADPQSFEEEAKAPKRRITAESLSLLHTLALDTFPINMTQWAIDPYPDGVQSLPADLKKFVRNGSRCECIDATGKRKAFMWRASHDMILFEWKILSLETKLKEVDPQYPHVLAVSRFVSIEKGVNHPYFVRAVQLGDRGATETRCCTLIGPTVSTVPEGIQLCLKFKDSHSRDAFLEALSNWREACAFGFI